ncbi:MAG: hypothetical protein ACI8PT_000460, partial [Gammaproteobacteria bacterium]
HQSITTVRDVRFIHQRIHRAGTLRRPDQGINPRTPGFERV